MFFRISNKRSLQHWPLSESYQIENYWLHLDQGWERISNIFYKGYAIGETLKKKVESKNFSECNGNYTILDLSSKNGQIYHDNSRAFPLWHNNDILTNIYEDGLRAVYSDGGIVGENQIWQFVSNSKNIQVFDPAHLVLTKTKIVDLVCNYLITSVEQLDTDLPILAADSEGVDSTLVRSVFDYCNRKYTLVKNNSKKLQPLGWGYKQLHVSTKPHLQLTGFCGDELLLRNPLYCQWLLDPYNIELVDEFDKIDYSYMKGFFDAKYKVKLKNRKERFVNKEQTFNHTMNVAINDFQMWHIDNTITFTPLRNRQIATECMYADVDAILDQVIHAGISKEIIKRLNPKILDTISKHKNDYK